MVAKILSFDTKWRRYLSDSRTILCICLQELFCPFNPFKRLLSYLFLAYLALLGGKLDQTQLLIRNESVPNLNLIASKLRTPVSPRKHPLKVCIPNRFERYKHKFDSDLSILMPSGGKTVRFCVIGDVSQTFASGVCD